MDESPSSKQQYAYQILYKWFELIEAREVFRFNYLNEREDTNTYYKYISKLTSLWIELAPKVKGRTEFKELETKFNDFRPYVFEPKKFKEGDNQDKAIELEEILRQIVEALDIT